MSLQFLAQEQHEYLKLIEQQFQLLQTRQIDTVEPLLEILEDFELNFNIPKENMTADFAIYQLLAYLAQWDTDNARFFWKRLSSDLQKLSFLPKIYELEKLIWDKQYDKIQKKIKELIQQTQQNQQVQALLNMILKKSEQELVKVITKNFSVISLKQFASILDFSNFEQAKNYVNELKWEFIDEQHIKTDMNAIYDKSTIQQLTNEQLTQITDMVGYLETLN